MSSKVKQLSEMGFDPIYCEYALSANNDNLELALDYLVKNPDMPKELKEKKVFKEEEIIEKIELKKEIKKENDYIIYINCAGSKFATMHSTIEKVKDTKFYRLIMTNEEKDKEGNIFIDRPPKYFEFILNYLRTGRKIKEEEEEEDELFSKEMKFYQLDKYFELKQNESFKTLFKLKGSSDFTITSKKGSIELNKTGGTNTWTNCHIVTDKPISSGKHYWEIEIINIQSDKSGTAFGITKNQNAPYFSSDITVGMSGSLYGGVSGTAIYGNNGDKIGIFCNFDKGQVEFYHNGSYRATASISKGTQYFPVFHIYYVSNIFKVSFPKKK